MVEYQHVTSDMSVYRDGTIKLHGPEGFEGMRAALTHGVVAWDHLAWAVLLDGVWMAVAAWIFLAQFHQARVRGALLNIGE